MENLPELGTNALQQGRNPSETSLKLAMKKAKSSDRWQAQRRQKCSTGRKTPKRRKAKRWPKKNGAPLFIGIQKPRYSKGQAAWKCFPKPNEKVHRLTTSHNWCDPSLHPQMTRLPRCPKKLKRQIIHFASTHQLPDRIETDGLRGRCGGFPSTCPPLNSKPLGLSKISRWSIWDQPVWTKTSLVWRKRRKFSFFLNVK